MRKFIVVGANLTKDAEVKDIGNRKAINFSIAYNEYFVENGEKMEHTEYYNCVIWRDENVNIAKYLTKGTMVAIQGVPKDELYKNKDGETKSAIKIIVNEIKLLRGGNNPSENNNTSNNSQSNNKNNSDDLPF